MYWWYHITMCVSSTQLFFLLQAVLFLCFLHFFQSATLFSLQSSILHLVYTHRKNTFVHLYESSLCHILRSPFPLFLASLKILYCTSTLFRLLTFFRFGICFVVMPRTENVSSHWLEAFLQQNFLSCSYDFKWENLFSNLRPFFTQKFYILSANIGNVNLVRTKRSIGFAHTQKQIISSRQTGSKTLTAILPQIYVEHLPFNPVQSLFSFGFLQRCVPVQLLH